MTPEFVRCDECQCWNPEHWVFAEEAKGGKEHNKLFAICQRRAPVPGESHRQWSYLYIKFFKFLIPTGFNIWRQNTSPLASKRFDEGCWEGIKK